jgi:hypothetical protein
VIRRKPRPGSAGAMNRSGEATATKETGVHHAFKTIASEPAFQAMLRQMGR